MDVETGPAVPATRTAPETTVPTARTAPAASVAPAASAADEAGGPAATPGPPTARVRGAARDAEILQATLDLLASDGYDQLTMDAVAARARAGKATLYRRWENKAQLVLDALEQLEEVPMTACGADTGTLRGDLMALVCERPGQLVQQRFAVVCGLFTALHRSPELAGAFKLRFLKRRLAELDAAFTRAAARGELRPDCPVDLVVLIMPAMGMLHGMTTAGQFDLAYVGRVVDEVVLPLALAGGVD